MHALCAMRTFFDNTNFFIKVSPERVKWEVGIVYFVLGKGDSMHWDWNSLAKKQEKVEIYLNLVLTIYVSIHPAMPWVQRFSELNIAQKVNLDNHIVENDFATTVPTK